MTAARDAAQKAIDRLTLAASSERLRGDLVELLEDEPFSRLDEWAESLRSIADAVDAAKDALETWRDTEDREERAAAKEDAVAALDTLLADWDASPLDVAALTDYDPEDEA